MYIAESHCCTAEMNNIVNQLYFNKKIKKNTGEWINELYYKDD